MNLETKANLDLKAQYAYLLLVVAVTSKSFSENGLLRTELLKVYPKAKFNNSGRILTGVELVDFLRECTHAIVGLEKIDASILRQVPTLRIISKYGVGLDSINLTDLISNKVKLAWTAGVNRRAVAELTIHHMISCVRYIFEGNHNLRNGKWSVSNGRELSSLSVGIVGFGNVGSEVVRLLSGFGCSIFAYDIIPSDKLPNKVLESNVKFVDFATLLSKCDVVSLHVPLTNRTKGWFDKDTLMSMRNGAVLINTARGGIVNEAHLFDCLNMRHISAAAFDVFEEEPNYSNPLISHPCFLGTPHMGASSLEAKWNMGMAAINGLENAKDPGEFMYLQE